MASRSSHLSRMPGGRQLELPFRVNVLIELGNVCFSLTLHTKFADDCHRPLSTTRTHWKNGGVELRNALLFWIWRWWPYLPLGTDPSLNSLWVFLLTGNSGSGKSTIANTVCQGDILHDSVGFLWQPFSYTFIVAHFCGLLPFLAKINLSSSVQISISFASHKNWSSYKLNRNKK